MVSENENLSKIDRTSVLLVQATFFGFISNSSHRYINVSDALYASSISYICDAASFGAAMSSLSVERLIHK